jgi:CCR4-NOT transcription complex subunit 1
MNVCGGLMLYFYYRAVPIAMDRAIKEIVSSIVKRSVSIATQTTKELVLKVNISVKPSQIWLPVK